MQVWGCSDPGPRRAQAARGCVVAVTAGCRPFQTLFNTLIYFLSSLDGVSLWGKLRIYLAIFLSGNLLPNLPYQPVRGAT